MDEVTTEDTVTVEAPVAEEEAVEVTAEAA